MMIRFVTLLIVLVFAPFFGWTQSANCNFDSPQWGYSIQSFNTAQYAMRSDMPGYPQDATAGYDGSVALVSSGGEVRLNMFMVNSADWVQPTLSFRCAALAESGTGKGMDLGTDYLKVESRVGLTSSWTTLMTIRGYGNSLWSMNGRGVSTQVHSGEHGLEIIPFTGGEHRDAALSQFHIDALPSTDSLFIRFVLFSDRTNELWSIDDIHLQSSFLWTNALSTSSPNQSGNWKPSFIPDSTSQLILTDTTPIWFSGSSRWSRVLVHVTDTFDARGVVLETGNISILNGYLQTDSTVCLTDELGIGEVNGKPDRILGDLRLRSQLEYQTGWRHLFKPLACEWSEVLSHWSNVQFSGHSTPSFFQWDAPQAQWSSPSQANSADRALPAAVFTGQGWLDSNHRIDVSGGLVHADTFALAYGVPSSNGPFASTSGNNGWNFVGNPFPMTLSLDSIMSASNRPASLSSTAYVWDVESDSYQSYSPVSGGLNGGVPYVRPWQGFWVQLSSDPGQVIDWSIRQHRSTAGSMVMWKEGNSVLRHNFTWKGISDSGAVAIVDIDGATPEWQPDGDHVARIQGSTGMHWLSEVDSIPLGLKSLDQAHIGPVAFRVFSSVDTVITLALEGGGEWWLHDPADGSWVKLDTMGYPVSVRSQPYQVYRTKIVSLAENSPVTPCELPDWTLNAPMNEPWKAYDLQGRLLWDSEESCFWPTHLKGWIVWQSETCAVKTYIN